jgi:mercuric ion transport protein
MEDGGQGTENGALGSALRCIITILRLYFLWMKSTFKAMKKENISSTGTLFASALAAICCVGPAVALVTGASMGILGSLMVLDPYRPWLLGLAAIMLGYSFFRLFVRKTACACEADFRARKVSMMLFWSAVCLFTAALTYQQILNWVYG